MNWLPFAAVLFFAALGLSPLLFLLHRTARLLRKRRDWWQETVDAIVWR